MAITRRGPRRRKATKRLDLTDMRDIVLHGLGSSVRLGIVIDFDGGGHFEIVPNSSGGIDDVLVEVELMPERTPLTARLGSRSGMWSIPAVGTEVIVGVPDRQLDFHPTILAELGDGNVPSGSQGVDENRTIITNAEVFVHDGSGGAVPLALKSDVDAIKTAYDAHTHLHQAGPGPPPAPIPTAAPLPVLPAAAGTTVFKAK